MILMLGQIHVALNIDYLSVIEYFTITVMQPLVIDKCLKHILRRREIGS